MKEIYKKIMAARQHISMTNMKKEGYNSYSDFYYFTPDQINNLVFLACQESGLLTLFDLKRSDLGEFGELHIIDLESNERLTITMATAIPVITATNAAQQLGGCVTYTERYLKMSAFGITDNSLDPDGKKPDPNVSEKKWLNTGTKEWNNAVSKLKASVITIEDVKKAYKIRKDFVEKLINESKK